MRCWGRWTWLDLGRLTNPTTDTKPEMSGRVPSFPDISIMSRRRYQVSLLTCPTGGAAMGGSLRSSLAVCARLPIHIAMGGYASHGRTSVRALKWHVIFHGKCHRYKSICRGGRRSELRTRITTSWANGHRLSATFMYRHRHGPLWSQKGSLSLILPDCCQRVYITIIFQATYEKHVESTQRIQRFMLQ